MNSPLWFLLVHDWVIKRRMTGLSIPFLVGAQARQIGPELGTIEEAKKILLTIVDKPVSGYIAEFRWCNFLKTYVVGLREAGGEQMLGQVFTSPTTGATSVIIQFELCRKWGRDIGSIIDHLVEEVRQPIEDKLFSRSPSSGKMNWQEFDESDYQRIDKAFGVDSAEITNSKSLTR